MPKKLNVKKWPHVNQIHTFVLFDRNRDFMERGTTILSFFSEPLNVGDLWVIGIILACTCLLAWCCFHFFIKKRSVTLCASKNSRYFPSCISYVVVNNRKQSVWVNEAILTFKTFGKSKKFKIKGINGAQIYPLELLPKDTHELSISLIPFHKSEPKLRFYHVLHLSIRMENGEKREKRLLLRPTLLRTESHQKTTK